ncbi:hypothetical protein GN956_G17005 [Arapaima gigas]
MASGSDFFANINNSVMQTSRAQDVRKDTEKLMKNDYDWEQYLVHVPVSVAVLGHLVCVSARKDFAINHGMEHRTFQYIKYPESFRACLMQVCNGAWEAFNSAHKSMDQIRRYSLQMPRNLSTVVETLMQDNDAIVSSLLPGQLQNIEDVTHECYQLASQVESQFMYVISVISELMEAFTCSTKLHNDSVREAMERCNLEKIDFEETLKLLAEGMQALAQVKQQWSNLVQFFQNISSLIKVSLSQEIHKFVMECRSLPQIKEYSHSAFLKDLIYQQASEAGNISNIVHSISDTYVTVSRLYLMDMVGGLGILMATKPSLQDYRTLQNGCRRAMEDINRLVSRNMLEFSGGIQQRIRTIDGNLEAVLPSSQDRVREIKKSYGEGPDVVMKKLSEKDRDQFC